MTPERLQELDEFYNQEAGVKEERIQAFRALIVKPEQVLDMIDLVFIDLVFADAQELIAEVKRLRAEKEQK